MTRAVLMYVILHCKVLQRSSRDVMSDGVLINKHGKTGRVVVGTAERCRSLSSFLHKTHKDMPIHPCTHGETASYLVSVAQHTGVSSGSSTAEGYVTVSSVSFGLFCPSEGITVNKFIYCYSRERSVLMDLLMYGHKWASLTTCYSEGAHCDTL
jgi:hypothetical protein